MPGVKKRKLRALVICSSAHRSNLYNNYGISIVVLDDHRSLQGYLFRVECLIFGSQLLRNQQVTNFIRVSASLRYNISRCAAKLEKQTKSRENFRSTSLKLYTTVSNSFAEWHRATTVQFGNNYKGPMRIL